MNCYKGIRSISCNQQCMHACSMISPKLYLPYLPCMHMYCDWQNFPLYTCTHALHPRPSCGQGVIGASTEAVQERRIVKGLIKSFRRTQLHSDRLLFFWYLHRATPRLGGTEGKLDDWNAMKVRKQILIDILTFDPDYPPLTIAAFCFTAC